MDTKEKISRNFLEILGASTASYLLLTTILEKKELMSILARDDLSLKEKLNLLLKEYLPEENIEDLLEVGTAVLTAIALYLKESDFKSKNEAFNSLLKLLQL